MRMIWQNLIITVVVLLPSVCWSASLFPDRYDHHFKDAAIFLPISADWRLLKAQCYQESRLRPFAVSPVGAQGLCQFMPNTWAEMIKKHPELKDPWLPQHSILAAALYMQRLNKGWISPRPQSDRYNLALSSYNAGFGNILKAQQRCNNAVLYQPIIKCLPKITGRHSKETIDYVKHIQRFYEVMVITSD